ncbi:MAG: hypothetical protein ABJN35_03515 [Erythrobacter sp.]
MTETPAVEAILRDELARGNRALSGVAPVISHMLESSGHALVSDAIVARLRGMLTDLVRQLITASAAGADEDPIGGGYDAVAPTVLHGNLDNSTVDRIADHLAGDAGLLNHLYALAMEGHLTERLEQRSSVDPVLSPLLQELIASDQAAIAELAMTTLAAQSRFTQSQRRMELPIGELPADLFASTIKRFKKVVSAGVGVTEAARIAAAMKAQKSQYDEGAGRLGLLARLVSSMRGGAVAALDLDHAGLALFTTGIATLTRQPRDLAVLACHERQAARLALSLRAAGMQAEAIERQFLLIEPSEMLPHGIGAMAPERAQELLAGRDASYVPAFGHGVG